MRVAGVTSTHSRVSSRLTGKREEVAPGIFRRTKDKGWRWTVAPSARNHTGAGADGPPAGTQPSLGEVTSHNVEDGRSSLFTDSVFANSRCPSKVCVTPKQSS